MKPSQVGRILAGGFLAAVSLLVIETTDEQPVLAAACSPVTSTVGTDVVVKFSTVGTCEWTVPSGVTQARALLIGGGGGGGFDIGGGGGAGGLREIASVSLTAGEVVSVVVGAGGVGDTSRGTPCVGSNGGTTSLVSTAGTVTALGGGGGGGQDGGGACSTNGVNGASGGGGGVGLQWPKVGGSGTYATDGDATTFGNNGGNTPTSGGYYAGGGGGGAGAAGGNGSSDGSGAIGGAGGAGYSSDITGVATTYAGGGAGGFYQNGTRGIGGTGGGGNGGTNSVAPTAGTNGLGGGGGGGGVQSGALGQGATGGSGIVILRYSASAPTTTTTTTTTNTNTTTTTTTTTTPTTTTAPRSSTSAPALEIVVEAPSTSAVGQVAVATIAPTSSSPSTSLAVVSAVSVPRSSTSVVINSTVVPASTTTQPAVPKQPVPPTKVVVVDPGEAGVQVGDEKSDAVIERQENQLIISAGPLKATIGSLSSDGGVLPLDANGNVVLHAGDTVRVKLSGFTAGTQVEAWLFSTPQLLGTSTVAADGTVTGVYTVPKDVLVGNHRIVLVAKTPGSKATTLTIGVMVGEWEKEANITVWLIVLPIVFAMVGALVLPATRRRRRRLTA